MYIKIFFNEFADGSIRNGAKVIIIIIHGSCRTCEIISMERNRQLAELSRVIEGRSSVRDLVSSNVSPVLPMNRYRFGPKGLYPNMKTGSHLSRRIVLHPESQRLNQERTRKLAELSKFIIGQDSQPKENIVLLGQSLLVEVEYPRRRD